MIHELIEDRSVIVPVSEEVTPEQRQSALAMFVKFGWSMKRIAEHHGWRRIATAETVVYEAMISAQRKAVRLAEQRGRLLAFPNRVPPGAPAMRVLKRAA